MPVLPEDVFEDAIFCSAHAVVQMLVADFENLSRLALQLPDFTFLTNTDDTATDDAIISNGEPAYGDVGGKPFDQMMAEWDVLIKEVRES